MMYKILLSLLFILFSQSILAEGDVNDPYYSIAASQVNCNFRNLYTNQANRCELMLVYEKQQEIATLYLFKSRKDPHESYSRFVAGNTVGHQVKTFDLKTLFGDTRPILAISAMFQDGEKIKFKARFETETEHQEELILDY